MDITIHGASNLRVESYSATNNNCITLMVESEAKVEVVLFGLPKQITDKLLLAFSDERTRITSAAEMQSILDEAIPAKSEAAS